MVKDNGDMESESDRSDCEGMPPLEDSDGDELALPVAKSLVIRQTLQVQVKEDETNQQRENIFHTRCYVQSKMCGLIIDSGSCVNVCSTTLVSKLNLCTVKHAKPFVSKLNPYLGCCWGTSRALPGHRPSGRTEMPLEEQKVFFQLWQG